MNGGVTHSELAKMSKKKFMFLMKRLREQLKKENDEMQKSSKATSSAPSGRMKYLGRT